MAVPVRHRGGSGQPVQRWEPYREFEDLQDTMGRLLESVWSGTDAGDGHVWAPLVDIEETEDAWIVEAEVPGVKKNDLNVEVRDSELEISGEIKERERKGIIRRRTRRTGKFDLRVAIPGNKVDPEKIEANVKEGVLTVRIPKPEQARPHRVEVQPGDSSGD